MPTIRFQEVSYQTSRNLKCACGKRFKRSVTFSQTINPFNRTADGQVKDYPTIWKELKAEAEEWQPEAICTACREFTP